MPDPIEPLSDARLAEIESHHEVGSRDHDGIYEQMDRDMELAAHAREDVPALLREVERLRGADVLYRDAQATIMSMVRSTNAANEVLVKATDQIERRIQNAEAEADAARLREALEFYAKDDAESVRMEILESVDQRPATAALAQTKQETPDEG